MCKNSYNFFENKECEYYPCHKDIECMNCLFCYCPLYHLDHCPGDYKYIKVNGQQIKECTNCTFPHKRENYDTIIKILTTNNERNNIMSLEKLSKFISLILRHKPESIGIALDEHGWANVDELVNGINKSQNITKEILEKIVAEDNKQRYSFNEDKTLIRANQGHSIPVDVELEEVVPPKYLYHGTGRKYVASINRQGLIPKSRLYVHLSNDTVTATNVGTRHGIPVVYCIDAGKMHENGYKFYLSKNGVYLTKEVPIQYLASQIKYVP